MPSASLSSPETHAPAAAQSPALRAVIDSLEQWLEAHDYRAYDTFDGLNARWVRPLTFERPLLRTVLQQGVRRFPLNLRPLLGVRPERSTKGMGFLARGYIRLWRTTGERRWRERAESALEWLLLHQAPGYSGACWGNHFDYQSRVVFVRKQTPSVVWTSLIGHAFLDAYEEFGDGRYLETAASACLHIERDLGATRSGDTACIRYFPVPTTEVHNASTLGASLLARTAHYRPNPAWLELAAAAMRYTAGCQRGNGSWYYGEAANLRWVDNFHTAYVLDCFKWYGAATGDDTFDRAMMEGYRFWKQTFLLADGTPRYYDRKTLPLDIQCCSQAIDTLVFFADRDPEALALAARVADWTVKHMRDRSGYFYYRRYAAGIVNRTPTLHWGQATMMAALAALYAAQTDAAQTDAGQTEAGQTEAARTESTRTGAARAAAGA